MPNATTISERFTYHAPKTGQPEKYQEIRGLARNFAEVLAEVCPESRELQLAIEALDVAVMHANSALARHG